MMRFALFATLMGAVVASPSPPPPPRSLYSCPRHARFLVGYGNGIDLFCACNAFYKFNNESYYFDWAQKAYDNGAESKMSDNSFCSGHADGEEISIVLDDGTDPPEIPYDSINARVGQNHVTFSWLWVCSLVLVILFSAQCNPFFFGFFYPLWIVHLGRGIIDFGNLCGFGSTQRKIWSGCNGMIGVTNIFSLWSFIAALIGLGFWGWSFQMTSNFLNVFQNAMQGGSSDGGANWFTGFNSTDSSDELCSRPESQADITLTHTMGCYNAWFHYDVAFGSFWIMVIYTLCPLLAVLVQFRAPGVIGKQNTSKFHQTGTTQGMRSGIDGTLMLSGGGGPQLVPPSDDDAKSSKV